MIALLLFGAFFVLIFLRVPIAISLGISSLIVLVSSNGLYGLEAVTDIMYTSVAKFTLLAIPFFIFCLLYTSPSPRD